MLGTWIEIPHNWHLHGYGRSKKFRVRVHHAYGEIEERVRVRVCELMFYQRFEIFM